VLVLQGAADGAGWKGGAPVNEELVEALLSAALAFTVQVCFESPRFESSQLCLRDHNSASAQCSSGSTAVIEAGGMKVCANPLAHAWSSAMLLVMCCCSCCVDLLQVIHRLRRKGSAGSSRLQQRILRAIAALQVLSALDGITASVDLPLELLQSFEPRSSFILVSHVFRRTRSILYKYCHQMLRVGALAVSLKHTRIIPVLFLQLNHSPGNPSLLHCCCCCRL
jgi:hypothetical protein